MPAYTWMCLYKQDSEYASSPRYAKMGCKYGFSICDCYTAFLICPNMPWQSSEYILGSKYAMILNILPYVLNM